MDRTTAMRRARSPSAGDSLHAGLTTRLAEVVVRGGLRFHQRCARRIIAQQETQFKRGL
jgi:hypothetical protein